MQLRTTVTVTERARPVIARVLASCSLAPGEDRAMAYASDYRNADGTAVEEFIPGYVVAPMSLADMRGPWVRVEGQDLPHFYLAPLGKWRVEKGFVLDVLRPGSSPFSIEAL